MPGPVYLANARLTPTLLFCGFSRDHDDPLLDIHHTWQAFEVCIARDHLCLLISSCGIHNRISHSESVLEAQIGSE